MYMGPGSDYYAAQTPYRDVSINPNRQDAPTANASLKVGDTVPTKLLIIVGTACAIPVALRFAGFRFNIGVSS